MLCRTAFTNPALTLRDQPKAVESVFLGILSTKNLTTYQLVDYFIAMEMKERILTSAQRLVQQRGFNGFSYADIAKEVGIRKASLHHHFPSKTDLGVALIQSYTVQLSNALAGINSSQLAPQDKLAAYIDIYRNALSADCMCLGGMLATEALTLDSSMLPSLKRFFELNVSWLANVLTEGSLHEFKLTNSPEQHARAILSALQGALLIARASGDHAGFEQTGEILRQGLLREG
ncbi:MAG: TetR family transcriptional regulator [Methylomonas sp.]|nr:MAG: TetR family transcriptional regulator [Methylobacter sp.]PPD36132.1 MAG: TetR family transcriptional regulator [Methylomonas sp.]